MNLKKNDILTADIIDITNLGFGVARHSGEVIFVSDCVTGDRVELKIIKTTSSYAVGKLTKIISASPYRTEGRCSIAQCKSCAYKNVSYEAEAAIKSELVATAFKKCSLSEVKIAPLVSSPKVAEYRNKAQYPIAKTPSGEYAIGFYAPKSHRVTEAAKCPLSPPVFAEILDTLRAFFQKHELSVYDEESGRGLLRHVYLRRGEVSGEILLTLVINGKSIPHSDELIASVTARFPLVVGILLNTNEESTNVILGDKYTTLFGRDYIFDTLAGVKLKITAPAFYQVNHDCAELLYAKARELAELKKCDTLLDLYCGAGSIGLSMADDCHEIVGIEIVDSAVECARFNARENGIENARFYTGDAKNTERLLENAEHKMGQKILPRVIILDPPRAGCDEALIKHICTTLSPEKVVYISCNPQTLARDCAIFKNYGFVCDIVFPFDLFPATGHVESVVCLTRRLDNELPLA
ncbi:MAG: 23S rRNA (uracil(1939)-C(5))-methyltransferase RlmD [Clostridia bacterium]|nr:23S rRNA (uracil(1939)-C(5))-methyltransferase RlmD [Clostridia bacterium]